MTFLNPLILLGLVAAAIPIIIHIFNLRKPQRIDFSSLKFLKDLEKTAVQKMRIQQWLLLALRILAVAALVLAFAQPIWENLNASKDAFSKTQTALILDNSLSMTLRDEQGAYWEQAKSLAQELVRQAPKGDEFRLFESAGRSKNGEQVFYNPQSILSEINKLSPKPESSALSKSIRRAVSQLQEVVQRNKAIFLFSDLQKSTFLDSIKTQIPKDIQVYLIPIGTQSAPKNVSISQVEVIGGLPEVGKPVKVKATLQNHAKENIDGYVVSVYLAGQRVGEQAIHLKPKSKSTIDFEVVPKTKGWLSGEIRSSEDAFPYDNKRYFVLHLPEQYRLLNVTGNQIESSFTDLALSSEVAEGTPAFQTTNMPEGGFSTANFSNYDVVLLNGISQISPSTADNLRGYLQQGGGVLLSTKESGNLNNFLNSIGGGNLGAKIGEKGTGKNVAQFSSTDDNHPIFMDMFDGLTGNRTIESPNFQSFVQYNSGNKGEQTLIKLSSGSPFLQEIRYGKGKLLLSTSPFDPQYSDLPLRGLFIPLLYRSLFYLSSASTSADYNVEGGKSAELHLFVNNNHQIRLKSATGTEIIPSQRNINGTISVQLDNAIPRAGIYEVYQGNELLRRIAINMSDAESQLNSLAVKEAENLLAKQSGKAPIVLAAKNPQAKQKITNTLKTARLGTALWQWMLIAALIFLLLEMFVTVQQRKLATA